MGKEMACGMAGKIDNIRTPRGLNKMAHGNWDGRVPIHLPIPSLIGGMMSVQAISWVIDHSKQKSNAFVVLLMIANHARSDGSGAWPSISTLAKESRLGERTIQRAIRKLAKHGELRVQNSKGPYGSNLYDIPGVRLAPGGVKRDREGCQSKHSGGVIAVSPNPSLTVHKDKEGNYYEITAERTRRILSLREIEERGLA